MSASISFDLGHSVHEKGTGILKKKILKKGRTQFELKWDLKKNYLTEECQDHIHDLTLHIYY
jgi:hypothetical protein